MKRLALFAGLAGMTLLSACAVGVGRHGAHARIGMETQPEAFKSLIVPVQYYEHGWRRHCWIEHHPRREVCERG
jgi:hypothetical protein